MSNRDFPAENTRLELIAMGGVILRQGDRVRLRPRAGGDIRGLALAGKVATIESIEQDYENRIYLAVSVDDDPGKEFGLQRQPGQRFFFSPDEIELLGIRPPRDV
jgi:hypothetical protein